MSGTLRTTDTLGGRSLCDPGRRRTTPRPDRPGQGVDELVGATTPERRRALLDTVTTGSFD